MHSAKTSTTPHQANISLRIAARILLAIATITLIIGTHWPSPTLPGALQFSFSDKLIHILLYATIGGLARLSFDTRIWIYATLGIALAACDEMTQPWFNRQADLFDFIADVIGLAIGICIASGMLKLLSSGDK